VQRERSRDGEERGVDSSRAGSYSACLPACLMTVFVCMCMCVYVCVFVLRCGIRATLQHTRSEPSRRPSSPCPCTCAAQQRTSPATPAQEVCVRNAVRVISNSMHTHWCRSVRDKEENNTVLHACVLVWQQTACIDVVSNAHM
jgi:hypothetical protein